MVGCRRNGYVAGFVLLEVIVGLEPDLRVSTIRQQSSCCSFGKGSEGSVEAGRQQHLSCVSGEGSDARPESPGSSWDVAWETIVWREDHCPTGSQCEPWIADGKWRDFHYHGLPLRDHSFLGYG